MKTVSSWHTFVVGKHSGKISQYSKTGICTCFLPVIHSANLCIAGGRFAPPPVYSFWNPTYMNCFGILEFWILNCWLRLLQPQTKQGSDLFPCKANSNIFHSLKMLVFLTTCTKSILWSHLQFFSSKLKVYPP